MYLLYLLAILFISASMACASDTYFHVIIIFLLLSILFTFLATKRYKKCSERKYQRKKINEEQYNKATQIRKSILIYLIVVSFFPTLIFFGTMLKNGKFFPGYYLSYTKNSYSGTCAITDVKVFFVESIDIPETIEGYRVTSIEDEAFLSCDSLKNITIPDSVTEIGDKAFSGCSSLTNILIPNSVTSIGEGVFLACSNLTSITVAEGNSIYYSEGNCLIEKEEWGEKGTIIAGCISSEIPNDESVIRIENQAFADCSKLTSIKIPDSVTNIGDMVFSGCSSLTSITVADDNPVYHSENNCLIETESKALIVGCMTSVIPDGVTDIGQFAFSDCSSLTNITIPDSVTSISRDAFRGCSSLTNITIPDSVTSIGERAFLGCAKLIQKENRISYVDKWVINVDSYFLKFSTKLRENTVGISDNALGTKKLTHITLPNSVRSIGNSAFSGCSSLTSITIPDSVTSIGESAFAGCTSLTSVTIPDSVTSIGDYAFRGCTSLTSITIPDSATSIGDQAFYGCSSLTSITLPNSVTSIGGSAFEGCTGLTSIAFEGTMAQWNAMDFGYEWNYDVPATEVICSDGVVSLN